MSLAVVWSKNGCVYCTKAKDFLNKKGITCRREKC